MDRSVCLKQLSEWGSLMCVCAVFETNRENGEDEMVENRQEMKRVWKYFDVYSIKCCSFIHSLHPFPILCFHQTNKQTHHHHYHYHTTPFFPCNAHMLK